MLVSIVPLFASAMVQSLIPAFSQLLGPESQTANDEFVHESYADKRHWSYTDTCFIICFGKAVFRLVDRRGIWK